MPAARRQDDFKLKTLEAMAQGGNAGADAFQASQANVSSAADEALAGQAQDAADIRAAPNVAAAKAAPIAGPGNVAQDYLSRMADASAQWQQATGDNLAGLAASAPQDVFEFQRQKALEREALYAAGGGGSSVSSADDEFPWAIDPKIYPEAYGGGLRYGGFQTSGEFTAAVEGKAEMDRQADVAAVDQAAIVAGRNAVAPIRDRQEDAEAALARQMIQTARGIGQVVVGEAAPPPAAAQQARGWSGWPSGEQRSVGSWVPRSVPMSPGTGIGRAGGAPHMRFPEAPPEESDAELAIARQMAAAQQAAAVNQTVQANTQQLIPQARSAARAGVYEAMPIDELYQYERQVATEDFAANPYEAAGRFTPPTPAEQNYELKAAWELEQRSMSPDGLLPSERNAVEDAAVIDAIGAEQYDEAQSLGLDPFVYMDIIATPEFQEAEREAARLYMQEGYQPSDIEDYLTREWEGAGTLTPEAMKIVMAKYSGLGVSASSFSPTYLDQFPNAGMPR